MNVNVISLHMLANPIFSCHAHTVYIFPGLGLGATLSGAKRVSDKMLYVAAEALANFVSDKELEEGKVFPPLSKIRDVSRSVAVAVIEQAMKEGQATKLEGDRIQDLEAFVHKKMYDPVYVPLVEKREITI
jgi:malate dehydrogenase (oxaloacetate-decarboxylating)(NADP+)